MKNINRFSKEYYSLINEYKHAHKIGIKKNDFHISENMTFDGKSLAPWVIHIKKIIDVTSSTSILDYGCGKAKLYKNEFKLSDRSYNGLKDYWNIKELKLFDPGVEEYEKYPNRKYDGVVCTDVLEHISKSDLEIVIKDIFNFSDKFVFFVISTVFDKKVLSDGRNVHQTVENEEWWKNFFLKIKKNFKNINCTVILTNLGDDSNKVKQII